MTPLPQQAVTHAPFFHARLAHGVLTTEGQPDCMLGHKVRQPDGSTDGIWAEWHWDGVRLHAANDRYGFCPLYECVTDDEVSISPSIAELVAHGASTELDEPALAVALRLGQFIGDDTPFRSIRCLAPHSECRWSAEGRQESGGYEFVQPIEHIERREAIEVYDALFKAAMQRRLPETPDFAVPLSGGRDSRHILLELHRSGYDPKFCVTALQYPDDVRVAAIVAEALGIEHVVIEQDVAPFELDYEKNAVSNFGADQVSWPLLVADLFAERGITTIYDGIAGDVLSAGLFLTRELLDLFHTEDERAVAAALLPDNEDLLAALLAQPLLRRLPRALALERMAREAARHFAAHNPVTSFFFWNRTRRKIAQTPFVMLSGPRTVYAPYLDHALFDFLAALPAELIVDHAFHTDTIRTVYPEWSHLPFEDKTLPGHDFSEQHAQYARSFSRYAGLMPRTDWIRQPSFSARLLASRFSHSFASRTNWFLRPALWVWQLEELTRKGGAAHG